MTNLSQTRAVIDQIIDQRLSIREAKVLKMRLDGLTLEDISNKFYVTRERVRQVEAKACRKLKGGIVSLDARVEKLTRELSKMSKYINEFMDKESALREFIKRKLNKDEKYNNEDYVPMEMMNIPTRVKNSLRKAGYKYIWQVKADIENIHRIKNIGTKYYQLIKDNLNL